MDNAVRPARWSRGFARSVQAVTWITVAAWIAVIVVASGLVGNDQPLAARLPDLISTALFIGALLVGAGVVHAVLEAAIAVIRMADDAASLPAIERNVRMNAQLPVVTLPAPRDASRAAERESTCAPTRAAVARDPARQLPVAPLARRRPATV